MNEQEKIILGSNTDSGADKENLSAEKVIRDTLLDLLNKKHLSRERLVELSSKSGIKVLLLCLRALDVALLRNSFVDFTKGLSERGPYSERKMEELVISFLEKIQQKPEQIEKVPKVTEASEVVVAPVIPIEEYSQPVVMPSSVQVPKVSKAPLAKPVFPKKTKEIIPQPEMKNWWEVKRETEVMAVEDLSGSMDVFERHVAKLGVARKDASGHWKWTGGNKKVVFLGDILGDYGMNGIEITNAIFDLAKQAEKVGGKTDMLCGNHDAFLINFLCQKDARDFCVEEADKFFTLFSGVWELAQYDPKLKEIELKKRKEIDKIENSTSLDSPDNAKKYEKIDKIKKTLVGLFYERIPLILDNMRNSSEGRKVLERICQIKVAVVHDDTLFCHTDPTADMIDDLTKDGDIARRVAEVNGIFQENLQKALFKGEKLSDDFNRIDVVYLNTGNRDYFVEHEFFEGLTKSLLAKLVERLYEKKQIRFDQGTEDKLDENGFSGLEWGRWQWYLTEKLKFVNINMEEDNIEEWKSEHGIKGSYIDEIGEILNKLFMLRKAKGTEEKETESIALEKLIVAMVEKIKKLNPIKDKIQKVRNSGINAIIHGHSPRSDEDGRYYDENGLVIVSPHAEFYDEVHHKRFEKGISVIKINGKLDLSGKVFRDKKK